MDIHQLAGEIAACPSLTDSNYYDDCTDTHAKIALTKEVIHRWGCGLRDAKDAVERSWEIVNDKSPRHGLQVQRTVLRDAIAELEHSPYARATYVRKGARALRELDKKIGVELQGGDVHPQRPESVADALRSISPYGAYPHDMSEEDAVIEARRVLREDPTAPYTRWVTVVRGALLANGHRIEDVDV